MINLLVADEVQHARQVRELFWEYLQWANANVREHFGVSFDIAAMLEADMLDLAKFMPPKGRVLLGYAEDQLAGIACLRQLGPGIGEVKRMYVRPGHRRIGLGRALLERLLDEAEQAAYALVRLDSAGFMTDAHRLYRGMGFREIEAYDGSEIPKEFQEHWVFMELALPGNTISSRNDAT